MNESLSSPVQKKNSVELQRNIAYAQKLMKLQFGVKVWKILFNYVSHIRRGYRQKLHTIFIS